MKACLPTCKTLEREYVTRGVTRKVGVPGESSARYRQQQSARKDSSSYLAERLLTGGLIRRDEGGETDAIWDREIGSPSI
jgi:hypothetical protein